MSASQAYEIGASACKAPVSIVPESHSPFPYRGDPRPHRITPSILLDCQVMETRDWSGFGLVRTIWHIWWTGVLALVPATATIYLLWRLFTALDTVGGELLRPLGLGRIPGVSLALLFLLILLAGMITTHYFGMRIMAWTEATVDRIPLVRSIYLTLKGMTDLFNFRSRFGQSTVVVFPFPRDGTWALGLVMGIAPLAIARAAGHDLLMVFVPTAIHPFTGYLAFIPTHALTRLNLPVEEAMKIEFSAGLYRPPTQWLELSRASSDHP